jgi:ABC-type transport system involved in multi-copper enzyme maturation permease subunit
MNSPILIIALNTFRELVRGKVLYSTLFLAILIVAASALFGSVSVGDQVLVIKDFGLFSISLSSILFAVITGASLLAKELERKTILNLLSKPVERWEFVFGKFIGMYITQLLYLCISSLILCSFVSLYTQEFDFKLLMSCSLVSFELLIISAACLFFSSIVVTPFLNGLFSFGLFLAGRSVEHLKAFSQHLSESNSMLGTVTDTIYYLLPHLTKVNVSDAVIFENFISAQYFFWALVYSLFYSGILLVIACLIFSKRDFN